VSLVVLPPLPVGGQLEIADEYEMRWSHREVVQCRPGERDHREGAAFWEVPGRDRKKGRGLQQRIQRE
jgi:hypothetical protein